VRDKEKGNVGDEAGWGGGDERGEGGREKHEEKKEREEVGGLLM
jgi:hypothetical protein